MNDEYEELLDRELQVAKELRVDEDDRLKIEKFEENARCQEKGKHGKFESLWLGPFVVTGKRGEDSNQMNIMANAPYRW